MNEDFVKSLKNVVQWLTEPYDYNKFSFAVVNVDTCEIHGLISSETEDSFEQNISDTVRGVYGSVLILINEPCVLDGIHERIVLVPKVTNFRSPDTKHGYYDYFTRLIVDYCSLLRG